MVLFKKKSIMVRNKNFFFIHKKWVGYFHVLHDPLGHLILLSYVYFITYCSTNCCVAIKCDFETLDRFKGESGKNWNSIFSGALM